MLTFTILTPQRLLLHCAAPALFFVARREMRDKLGKAATSADYRVYEREQEVRRAMEGDVTRWRSDHAVRDGVLVCFSNVLERRSTLWCVVCGRVWWCAVCAHCTARTHTQPVWPFTKPSIPCIIAPT